MRRRTLVALPAAVALGGCSLFDNWFGGDNKVPLPGHRESVALASGQSLQPDAALTGPLSLPPAVSTDWPQAGGNPAHQLGHVAGGGLAQAWRGDIGEGGGYRREITAHPVIANGRAYTMDSDGAVSAFDAARGGRAWHTDTQGPKDRSTNIGGGLAFDGNTLYAATGRAELLALDPATGKIAWRKPTSAPVRSEPTVADGRVYLSTIDDRMLAFSAADGAQVWSYQANTASTSVLGEPAPAFSDGLVVGGFGSGDLLALRADSGTVAWADSLASARGRNSLTDLSAIRALPVISGNRVYAIGLGGLMLALDLRSGRRLWERDVAGSNTPWLAGDWIFLVTSDQQLVAMAATDGRVRWTAALPRYGDPKNGRDPIFWRGPILAGDRLLVCGSTSRMLAIDPQTGHTISELRLPDAASLGPVAANGLTYVVTDDGTLSAFR